jgi:biopolymer transport protein ExbB
MIAPTSREHGPTGLLLCLLIFLCNPGHILAQTWLDAAWEYRQIVSVDNAANTSALTDYSVRVDLGAAFDFTHAQAGGEDVRFTAADGTTPLDYWIEIWDNVGDTAIVWVEVPAVSASSSIDVYMYYGNGAAADAANGDVIPSSLGDTPPR